MMPRTPLHHPDGSHCEWDDVTSALLLPPTVVPLNKHPHWLVPVLGCTVALWEVAA